MSKGSLTKMGIVIILLLLFIGYNVYLKWDKTHFTVDPEAFNVKDNFQQVMDAEYKWNEGLPLQLADQFNKIIDIDIDRELPNLQRRIKLHKGYFLPGMFFVLYSINLQKDDQGPEDIPELDFSKITFKTSDGDAKTFDTIQHEGFTSDYDLEYEGEVLDRRLYKSLVLEVDYEALEDEDFQNFQQDFEKVNNITLGKASLNKYDSDNEDNTNNAGNPIDNLLVSISFNAEEDYKFTTIPLNQEITLNHGQTLKFQDLDVTSFHNILYFQAEKDNQTIKNLDANITWEDKELHGELTQFNVMKEEESYITGFMRFDKIPAQLDFELQNISYAQSKDVSFNIPANLEETERSQKVGEVEGISFYFEGYEEAEAEGRVGLKLKWESSNEKTLPQFSFDNLMLFHDLQQRLRTIQNEEAKEWAREAATNIFVIKNEQGEKPVYQDQFDGTDSLNTAIAQDSITIYLNRTFVEKSKRLHITIKNFTYQENLDGEKVQIRIPDEYVTD